MPKIGYISIIALVAGSIVIVAKFHIEFWFNVSLDTLFRASTLRTILSVISCCLVVTGFIGVSFIEKEYIAKKQESRKKLLIDLKKHLLNLGIRTREDVLMLQKEIEGETNRQSGTGSHLNSITAMIITSVSIPIMRKILSLSFLSEFLELIGEYKLLQDPNLLLKVIVCSAVLFAIVIYIVRSFFLLSYSLKRILDKKRKSAYTTKRESPLIP